jgi:hypothetical protein
MSRILIAGGAFVLACSAGLYGGAWAARHCALWRRAPRDRARGQHRGIERRRGSLALLPEGSALPYEQAASWARQAMFGST